jgi:hypothetical protein
MGNFIHPVSNEPQPFPTHKRKQADTQSELIEDGDTLPTWIYSYKYGSHKLWRTDLVTGLQTCVLIPSYQFKLSCCWSELPGGSLLITGGGFIAGREVDKIDTLREFAVSRQPAMLTARAAHASVYHAQVLYVLGGYSDSWLKECERYVCAESRWEVVPPMPRAVCSMSGVVVEGSLYVLGGNYRNTSVDIVQKLSLDELAWKCMEFTLPHAGVCIPCFKLTDTEVCLVLKKQLYSFTPLHVLPLQPLPADILSWYGPSYLNRGTLYCSNYEGAALRLELNSSL